MTRAARFLVGIDLGTTHTVVAYADLQAGENASVHRFAIPQLIGPGELAQRPLLPSVRYHPAEGELNPEETRLPWPPVMDDPVPQVVLGELARRLGSKSQGRLITSAKSWLCHSGVDRLADILPWGAPREVPKVSPLIAGASYLAHVRGAWNYRFPEFPLETQEVVITVPASFDESARALTVEAAKLAGLDRFRLLEEPQSVCYDWLHRHRRDLDRLAGCRLLLVVDLGGGTTDLTLIAVDGSGREPKLTRIGVGDHLLLGGDNIDLMLAHLAEERLLNQGGRLSSADFAQLVEQCRLAKERLLMESGPDHATVTLLGTGRRLVGGARSVTLTREEVHRIVLDGFFPKVSLQDRPQGIRSGLVEFGLPYVADPAITRHIAAFLTHHRRIAQQVLGDTDASPVPDAVLLNGGVFLSPVLTRRLMEVIQSWGSTPLRLLDNPHPDFAVAAGAVAYNLARRGWQPRIGGGSPRSYFLVVEGEQGRPQGICLLPRGTEEEREILLQDRVFALRLGQPVRFHLVSSTEDHDYRPGEIVAVEGERFVPLPPLVVSLTTEARQEIPVHLAARLTEIGTLELDCVAIDDPARRWQLAFELRRQPVKAHAQQDASHPHLAEAVELINAVFGKKSKAVSPKLVKALRAELEKRLGPRHRWDVPLLRELADTLLAGGKHRRRSPEHERTWLSLTGFCLRPGFGYPLDDWRIGQIWPLYQAGLQFVNVIQNWAEWWTFWRRVAGGLDQAAQEAIFADIRHYLDPAKARKGRLATLARQRSYDNIVRLAAVLEHLPVEEKIRIGEWLLERLENPKEPEQTAWALGRVGSRVPFYGSAHNTVPRDIVETWLRHLLTLDFRKRPLVGFAVALLARMSGDRSRDIDPRLRQQVVEKLRREKAPSSWITMVTEVVELSAEDEQRLFGEALPPGLKLIA